MNQQKEVYLRSDVMNKESLDKVRSKLAEIIKNEKIDKADKMELILNLWWFLDSELYEDNIKTLIKYGKKREK